jgi:hypothetical protein
MAAYPNTFIGAFVIAKDKVTESEKVKYSYKNEKTGKSFNGPLKFDPETGDPISKLKEKYVEEKIVSGWYGLCREVELGDGVREDGFFEPAYTHCPKGHQLMIPQGDKGRAFDVDGDFTGVIDVELIESTMKGFGEEYGDAVKMLQDFYGEENVQVSFGIVNYSH